MKRAVISGACLVLLAALGARGGQIKDENQILNASLDLANGALRAEVAAGTPAPANQFLDNDQIFNLIFDSNNSSLRIECPTCGGGGGSSLFQINGTNAATQTTINFVNGSGITISNPSAGNISFSLSGALPVTQAAASHQFLNSYNGSTGAFTAAQPAFSDLSGSATLAQLPAIGFSNLTGTVSATQLAASPVTNDCIGYNGSALAWLACGGSGGSGTVTGFSAGNLSPLFTTSVANSTSTPALSFSLASEAANLIFAGPASGAAASPTFRALVAADIPALNYQSPLSTFAAAAHKFLTSFTSPNTFTSAQPAFSDLSGTVAATQLAASPITNDCLGYSGSSLEWTACGGSGGSGLTNWAQDGTTDAVIAQPASSQDATTLTLLGSTAGSPTADVFDICSNNAGACGTKYFWIGPTGSIGWFANALSLGSSTQQDPSYSRIYSGIGASSYVQFPSAALPAPAQPVPTSATTGGTIPAGTYDFEITYLAGPAQQYETANSTEGAVTTTGSTSTITVPAPAQLAGATGFNVYEFDTTQGAWSRMGTYTSFTNVTYTTLSGRVTATPPTSNNTGAQFNTYISSSPGLNGVACISGSAPGYDCASGTQILTQNSLIAGTNITLTPATDGSGDVTIAASGSGGGANAIVNNPSATQTITSTSASASELIIQYLAGQTADGFILQDSSGNHLIANFPTIGTVISTDATNVTPVTVAGFSTSQTADLEDWKDHPGGTLYGSIAINGSWFHSLTLGSPLPVASGGSGAGTFTAHGVLLGEGTSAFGVTGAGTAGQCLTSNGASADPTFQTCGTGAGVSSFTGDSKMLSNSASTGGVTATLANAPANSWWGNPTGASAQPAYNTSAIPVAMGGTGATSLSAAGITQTIASGTATLGTTSIASGACATVVTVAATGVLTTDVISTGFNGDPSAVTGYGVSASGAVLTIYPYPTAGNVNFKVCNSTGASITPGAMTLNWRVTR